MNEALKVLVIDFLLLVGKVQEVLVDLVERVALELVAELLEAMLERRMSAARGKDDLALACSDVCRVDDFVGVALLKDAVLVDARGMCERISADDCLVRLHAHARDRGDKTACLGELPRVDVGMGVELLAVHADAHDDFLERRVARTLAEAVDRALDLGRAVLHALERKRGRHAEVVVAVNRHGDVLDAAHVLHKVRDAAAELGGKRVSRGVGDVDDGRARVDNALDDLHEEVVVGTPGVLGVKLHVVHVLLGIAHAVLGALKALILGDAQLVVQMARAHADAGVDTRALGVLERLGRAVDVLLDGAREADDRRVVASELGDAADALEITGA